MEKENKIIEKNEQPQKELKNKKVLLYSTIIIVIGIALSLFQTLIFGVGSFMEDYIFQAIGGLIGNISLAFIIGLIPYFILKKWFSRLGLIIFSISFLLVSIITFLGNLYRG